MKSTRLILASASPRRKELLEQAGYVFDIITSDVDECDASHMSPQQLARFNAAAKAVAVAALVEQDAVVLGADTIVACENHIFGKPKDEQDALNTLRMLSGKTHQVVTGVCIAHQGVNSMFAQSSDVAFRLLTDAELTEYIATGEPLDKAGAYGIQGAAQAFVDHIEGEYETIVGLPMQRLCEELAKHGISPA